MLDNLSEVFKPMRGEKTWDIPFESRFSTARREVIRWFHREPVHIVPQKNLGKRKVSDRRHHVGDAGGFLRQMFEPVDYICSMEWTKSWIFASPMRNGKNLMNNLI